MKKQVVITGMGVVCPLGNNISEFSRRLFEKKSPAASIKRFNPGELPTTIAAEVKNFSFTYRDVKINFALSAAHEALEMAGLDDHDLNPYDLGLSIGLGLELFAMDDLIKLKNNMASDEEKKSFSFLNTPSDICCDLIAQRYRFHHLPQIHISACAAGTDAIGSAFEAIREGSKKIILAGGADSMINPMGIAGFGRIGAMSKKNKTPEHASSPFDQHRDGFLLGEGAGFVVLEERDHAEKRGAKILGRISGYGNSLDAYSVSDPHPEGLGAVLSMQRALSSAKLVADEISAISAHATGTPKNDPAEAKAIRMLMPKNWKETPVIATKSLIGHLISAAGAVETIATLIMMKKKLLHQTQNLEQVDPDCDLCHIKNDHLAVEINHVLKNSFGFGGQNSSIIISRE
jgi:3-oxoacyl-[acyl-carrier-protein] synthase II